MKNAWCYHYVVEHRDSKRFDGVIIVDYPITPKSYSILKRDILKSNYYLSILRVMVDEVVIISLNELNLEPEDVI